MDASWVVLRTQPHREQIAAHVVRAKGVDCFAPLLPPRRKKERAAPLFPGYVFARVEPESDDLLRIRSVHGVAYVLPLAAPPALLPEALIDELRTRLADPEADPARRRLQPGERVSVVCGPFRWSEALFDRYLNASGRVRILLEMVHRQVAVEIDVEDLERRR
jgi:transcriptional antiterminator RfaH